MSIRQEILNIPDSLRTTLEKGRPEFEALVRHTRWSGRPLFMVGRGSSYLAALTGALAFESLLGLPVVVRRALDFRAYSTAALERRSILFAVSQSGESTDTVECAHAARRRGVVVLALTGSPVTTLAKLADGVLLVHASEEQEPRVRTVICQQAALAAVGLLAARIVKAPDPEIASVEEELLKLPAQIEWTLTQFRDATRSLASELAGAENLSVLGSGFFRPAALQWSLLLGKLCGIRAVCSTPDEFQPGSVSVQGRPSAVIVLSSSRCKLKAEAHKVARECRKRGTPVFSVTDSADRELATHSTMAILLPTLHELPGSILTLALLDWVAWEMSREKARPA